MSKDLRNKQQTLFDELLTTEAEEFFLEWAREIRRMPQEKLVPFLIEIDLAHPENSVIIEGKEAIKEHEGSKTKKL